MNITGCVMSETLFLNLIGRPFELFGFQIVLKHNGGSPCEMAEKVLSYLDQKGFLQA